MKTLLLLPVISIMMVACNSHEKPRASHDAGHVTDQSAIDNADRMGTNVNEREVEAKKYPVDNTGRNVRDRDSDAKTPFNQPESKPDLVTDEAIRKAIFDDKELSTNAKNIKVIVIDGVVTLRGPIKNHDEEASIIKKITRVSGVRSIDNQLEMTDESVKTNESVK